MWEGRVCIYSTLEVPNNYPSKSTYKLFVLKKKSNAMWYDIVTNIHIAFNYIHIEFWVGAGTNPGY